MKNILILIAFLVYVLHAEDNNQSTADVNTTASCQITNEVLFQPITNETGKQIMTSKKVYRSCEEQITKEGSCEEWKTKTSAYTIPTVRGVDVIDYQSQSSMASVVAMMEAVNRSNVIFSGTKGVCEKGYTQDLSWTEDPLFWASVAGKAVAAMGSDDEAAKAEKQIEEGSDTVQSTTQKVDNLSSSQETLSNSLDSGREQLGEQTEKLNQLQAQLEAAPYGEAGDLPQQISDAQKNLDQTTTKLQKTAEDLDKVNKSLYDNTKLLEAQKDILKTLNDGLDNIYENQTFLQAFNRETTQGYAGCAISGMINLLKAAYDYKNQEEDECNPVDEICGGETTSYSATDPGMIYTMTEEEYKTSLKDKTELSSAYEVVKIENGFVTIRIYNAANTVDSSDYNSEADVKKAQDEARLKQFQMQTGMAALNMSLCMGSQASSDIFDTPAPKSQGFTFTEGDASDAALGAVIQMLPPEYQIVAMFVMKLLDTWEEVDSCHDEGDANRMGSRHVKAYRGLKFNTCHTVKEPYTVEEWPLTGVSMRKKSEYCCYESPISKILMVQFKAQLGIGWTNCTDVSWNQFSHIRWRECTNADKQSGMDGASFRGTDGVDYDMKNSYQYKKQCLNMDELIDYIRSQTGIQYDSGSIKEFFDDFIQRDIDE